MVLQGQAVPAQTDGPHSPYEAATVHGRGTRQLQLLREALQLRLQHVFVLH